MDLLQYKYWLFDLDGTIADSADSIIHSATSAYEHFGVEILDPVTIRGLIGKPGVLLFSHAGEEKSKEMLTWFRSHLAETSAERTTSFPGTVELFQQLEKQDRLICLASNKSEFLAKRVLEDLKLIDFFHFISCTDNCPPKPAPDVILNCLPKNEISAVMVGDTPMDILAAKAAGISVIAVTYGANNRQELSNYDPDLIVESLHELSDLVGW